METRNCEKTLSKDSQSRVDSSHVQDFKSKLQKRFFDTISRREISHSRTSDLFTREGTSIDRPLVQLDDIDKTGNSNAGVDDEPSFHETLSTDLAIGIIYIYNIYLIITSKVLISELNL